MSRLCGFALVAVFIAGAQGAETDQYYKLDAKIASLEADIARLQQQVDALQMTIKALAEQIKELSDRNSTTRPAEINWGELRKQLMTPSQRAEFARQQELEYQAQQLALGKLKQPWERSSNNQIPKQVDYRSVNAIYHALPRQYRPGSRGWDNLTERLAQKWFTENMVGKTVELSANFINADISGSRIIIACDASTRGCKAWIRATLPLEAAEKVKRLRRPQTTIKRGSLRSKGPPAFHSGVYKRARKSLDRDRSRPGSTVKLRGKINSIEFNPSGLDSNLKLWLEPCRLK